MILEIQCIAQSIHNMFALCDRRNGDIAIPGEPDLNWDLA